MHSPKILEFEKAPEVLRPYKAAGKRIVHCHGTFDLVHPGHIVHFEEAKSNGDILVVTVTGEQHVKKGPGRPFFNDSLRAKSIASLACVDHVVIVPYPAAKEAIECVQPDIYCKGKEYANPENDPSGNIHQDVETVIELGGQVKYLGSVVFSSTRLLNNFFDTHANSVKSFCRDLSTRFSADQFTEVIAAFSKLKVLVIGDIIFDHYSTVQVQGLTSKNKIISGRFVEEDKQLGGSLAVYRHIQSFCPNTKVIGLAGTDAYAREHIDQHIAPENNWTIYDESFTSIIKQRFVEPASDGQELSKLFSVNFLDGNPPSEELIEKLYQRIAETIADFDLVLVMDFGHGVMDQRIRDLVQEKAKYLAVNCQTNSNNHGFNILNRRYHRADSFSLDEAEMKLACGLRHPDFDHELAAVKTQLGSQYAWLTRGATQTIGMGNDAHAACPPFEQNTVDTIGAGDAFCALASLAACMGLPTEQGLFLGQLAGAQAVRYVGNSKHIEKGHFIKAGTGMLSY